MIKAEVRFEVDPSKLLAGLQDRLKKNILRKAIRRGAKRIKEQLKADAPHLSGLLQKSFSVKISTKKNSLVVIGIIGPRKDFEKEIDGITHRPVRYAHIVEFGRKEVNTRKAKVLSDHQRFFGKRVKSAPGQHFLAHTFNANKQSYIDIVTSVISEEVLKALHK